MREPSDTKSDEQMKRLLRAPKTIVLASGRLLLHSGHIARNLSMHVLYRIYHRSVWLIRRLPVISLLAPKLGQLIQHKPRELNYAGFAYPVDLEEHPRLCIVTPSYGQGEYIGRTIDSVLDQEYPNLHYVVQDGGSKDSTCDVVNAYGKRVDFESRPDNGQSHAINLGFAKTDGDIMAYLNSDDMLLPGSINRVIEYFNAHPDVDAVYGDRLMVDEQDKLVGRWVLPYHDSEILSWADYVPQETLFWRRRIWDKAGGKIDESFNFAMDWDLLLRFRNAGAKFHHMPVFLGVFRIHSSQKTSAEIDELGMADMARLRERELGEQKNGREIRQACKPFMLAHWKRDRRFWGREIPGKLPEYRSQG